MRILLLPLAAASITLTASPAHAYDPLEGLWGPAGASKIEARGDGSLQSTGIKGFYDCRPTGQPGLLEPLIGRESFVVRAAAPALYTGTWALYNTLTCAPIGRGAARVTLAADSFRFCGSVEPALPLRMSASDEPVWPTVCYTAARFAPPVPPARIRDAVRPLPSTRKCRSRRHVRIRLRNPVQDPLVSAQVRVNRRAVATQSGERATAPVDLRGLPRGRYAVTIRVTTATGRVLFETRRYRTCAPRR